jgi:hypothetical protein
LICPFLSSADEINQKNFFFLAASVAFSGR